MQALAVLAGLYLLYAMLAVWLHPKFIYPFDPTPFDAPGYVVETVESSAGEVTLVTAPGEGPPVLFLMGNAGSLTLFPRNLAGHRDAARNLMALAYPGGGGVPGKPSEALLKAQALVAHDTLAARSDAPVIVHGYSLGSSLALYVASERPVAAVILDAPFHRMCEQMARASFLPACQLPAVQKWDSGALADQVSAPVLIQHGAGDDLALPKDSARLTALLQAAGVSVERILHEGVGHNTLIDAPAYRTTLDRFIDAQK